MPKETFFNLNTDKQKKIEKAIENELGRTSVEKASISNIIEEAQIPRGSFYQYFEDKDDAIKYIIDKYMQIEKKYMKKVLKETNGDIFETFLRIFDYINEKSNKEKNYNLYRNIMKEVRKNNMILFSNNDDKLIKKENIFTLINHDILYIEKDKDLKYIVQILSILTRNANIKVNEGKENKENVKKELEEKFEILKRGMIKNKNKLYTIL